jgi:hypothetical protein
MIHKKQIADFAKSIIKHEKGIRSVEKMQPNREWLIGLVLALALFSLSATWGVLNYFNNRDLSTEIDNGQVASQVLYREEQVLEALKKIADRENNFTVLNEVNKTVSEIEEISFASTTEEEIPQVINQPDSEIIDNEVAPLTDFEVPSLDVN